MKQHLLLFIACMLMTSCATIVNSRHTVLTVYSEEPVAIIQNRQDTIRTSGYKNLNRALLAVERSKKPLTLTVYNDSLQKDVVVKPRNSKWFYMNAFSGYGIVGFLVDYKAPQRYSYGKNLLIDKNLEKNEFAGSDRVTKKYTYNKGDAYLNFSSPFVNFFNISPKLEYAGSKVGFLGISGGVDYFYQQNRFLNLSVSGIMNYLVPAPVGVCGFEDWESITSLQAAVVHGHHIKDFSLGYGLSVSQNRWSYWWEGHFYHYGNEDDEDKDRNKNQNTLGWLDMKNVSTALGLLFNAYYNYKSLKFGVFYRPSFYRFDNADNQTFKYEHLISIDLGIRFRIRRGK
ncbi:putative periplasmic lipoprotein [Viscerimonas tarda]